MNEQADGGSGERKTPSSEPPSSSFASRVVERSARLHTRVCLGIDPRPDGHPLTAPERFEGDPAKTARAVVHYFQAIVEATADIVACYKLQSAFFEVLGIPGLIAMAQLLADIRAREVPVILDGKRGDIGSTAAAYAAAYLADGVFAADALTVNPYLGLDTVEPFVRAGRERGRGVLILLRTSNPGSGDLQDLRLEDGRRLWERLAERLAELSARTTDPAGHSPVGAVVGATYPDDLSRARELLPRELLLVPGYGSQGGSAGGVSPAFAGGAPAVVSASRSLTYVTREADFGEAARGATERMRDELNAFLGS